MMTVREPLLHETSRFEDADAFYAALAEALDAAGEEEALKFLSRLVLLLANEIGRQDVLLAAIERAGRATEEQRQPRG